MKKILIIVFGLFICQAHAEFVDVYYSGPQAKTVDTIVINNFKSTPVRIVGNKGADGTICLWNPGKKKWNCLNNNRTIPTGATAVLWNRKPSPPSRHSTSKTTPFYQRAAKGNVFLVGNNAPGSGRENLGWDASKVAIKINPNNTIPLTKDNVWIRDRPTIVTLTDYGVAYSQLDSSTSAPAAYKWGHTR